MDLWNKTKQYFNDLMANAPEPKIGEKRLNHIFVFTLKLQGERRWFGHYFVIEEAVETMEWIEITACYDVVKFKPIEWADDI